MTGLAQDPLKSSLRIEGDADNTLKHLNSQRHQRILCDVVLIVDGEEFPAHKGVLAVHSKFFLTMFTTDMLEKGETRTCVNCVSAAAMRSLLEFMYSGHLQIHLDNVIELLEASNFLFVAKVKMACCEFLESSVDLENCLTILSIADALCCDGLSRAVTKYINQNFNELAKTEAFLKSGFDNVRKFLSSDDINVENEEQILEILVDWIKYDPERRQCCQDELVKLVRLPFIPASRLQDLKELSWPLATKDMMQTEKTIARKYYSDVEVIMVTGGSNGSTILSSSCCFIPVVNKWVALSNMKVPRWRHQMLVFKGHLLVLGGLRDVCVKEPFTPFVEVFFRQTNSWDPVPQQPEVRDAEIDSFCAVSTGNRVLVVGGIDSRDNNCTSCVYSVEGSSRTASLTALLVPRAGHSLVTSRERTYAIGGFQTPITRTMPEGLRSVECYELEQDAWNRVQPMNEGRLFAAAVSLNDKIFIFGGCDGQSILSSCEVYDAKLDQWQYISPMLVSRMKHSAAVCGGKIYVIGGVSARAGPGLRSVECYVPDEDRWTRVPDLPSGRFDHQSSVTNNSNSSGRYEECSEMGSSMDEINTAQTANPHSAQIFAGVGFPHPVPEFLEDLAEPSREEAIHFLGKLCSCLALLVSAIQSVLQEHKGSETGNLALFDLLLKAVVQFFQQILSMNTNVTVADLMKFARDPNARMGLIQGCSQLDRALAALQQCSAWVASTASSLQGPDSFAGAVE